MAFALRKGKMLLDEGGKNKTSKEKRCQTMGKLSPQLDKTRNSVTGVLELTTGKTGRETWKN